MEYGQRLGQSDPRANSTRNIVAGLLGAYGFISFWCFLFLEQKWAATAPTAPNPSLGLIYRHNDHGVYTYFSAFQATTCAVMFMTCIPVFMIAVAVTPKVNVVTKVRWFGFNSRWDADDPKSLRWKAALLGAIATPPLVFFVGRYLIGALNNAGVIVNLG